MIEISLTERLKQYIKAQMGWVEKDMQFFFDQYPNDKKSGILLREAREKHKQVWHYSVFLYHRGVDRDKMLSDLNTIHFWVMKLSRSAFNEFTVINIHHEKGPVPVSQLQGVHNAILYTYGMEYVFFVQGADHGNSE